MFALMQSKQTKMITVRQLPVSGGTSGFCVMVMRRELAAMNCEGWQQYEMQNLQFTNETRFFVQGIPDILLL
jgi:hypothetical protein